MAFACISVYDEILKWSIYRPNWQRDALRRLIVNAQMEEKDIESLVLFCKAAHGITETQGIEKVPIPLNETHVCVPPENWSIAVTSISEIKNVNAINSKDPLTFKERGLTIIYGDNGAGKSGYVRILKNVCRARSIDKRILPNIFQAETRKPPTAKIAYKEGAFDREFDWEQDKPSPPELVCINVLDSSCATLYVDKENKIVYMPLGLDVFDKLAKVCDEIKAKLLSEKGLLLKNLQMLPQQYEATSAGAWFSSINSATGAEEIDNSASFRDDEERRFKQLHFILVADSKKRRATDLRNKKKRYDQLKARLEILSASLSDEKLLTLKDVKTALDMAMEASRLASKTAFEDEPFRIGTSPWEQLWNAARSYSEAEAYPGKDFPYTGLGSKCVLCFQDLSEKAKQRFDRFRDFVLDTAAKNEKKAREAFETEEVNLAKIQIAGEGDEILMSELKEDNAELEYLIREYLKSAAIRKEKASAAIQEGTWKGIPGLSENPSEALAKLCTFLESTATELEKAEDPEALKALQAEFNELSAKKWVSEQRASIIEEVKRLQLIRKYDAAISEANTRPITLMSTELTEKYVTEELKHRFLEKLQDIYGKLNVGLEKKVGEKGSTYYFVKLEGSTMRGIGPSEIISEGESKAVALAEFLAEISCSPTSSGIVFDDPVSSLDHVIRENVAKEFVTLAKERQVIVFTHDLFFLVTLEDLAEKAQVPVHDQQVIREYEAAGAVYPDVPLEALKTKDRIKRMNSLLDDAEKRYKDNGMKAYEPIANQICKEMRKTIERAIEEVLLADIVRRYRRNIYASNVTKLVKMRKEDCIFLDDLMTDYSKIEHDQEVESRVPLPSPDKLTTDIKKLSTWVTEYNKREATL